MRRGRRGIAAEFFFWPSENSCSNHALERSCLVTLHRDISHLLSSAQWTKLLAVEPSLDCSLLESLHSAL